MKLNKLIASALISAALALEAWTLTEVINLKIAVAQITTRLANTKTIALQ
jgi:hypothetical protein